MAFWILLKLSDRMAFIQSILAFERWNAYPQFDHEKGLGRVGLLASMLGIFLGFNVLACLQLTLIHLGLLPNFLGDYWTEDKRLLALQWTVYVIFLCTFHLGEFFTTVIFNPTVASSDSFMVNHSKAYTAAALLSWTEFCIRMLFFPKLNDVRLFCLGVLFVVGGQVTRSWAMIHCGESFNHYIQRDKKDNHVLVTNGIYGYLRHPSYFGFYYWAVGTQLILCNPLSTTMYGIAAWTFFRYRITYEEETLRKLFPRAYEAYAARTYIGIPLLSFFVNSINK
eukprot:scaffold418_cov181-Alexandrium_tamarense.AAC.4